MLLLLLLLLPLYRTEHGKFQASHATRVQAPLLLFAQQYHPYSIYLTSVLHKYLQLDVRQTKQYIHKNAF